ncbi:hypothetical protein BJV74DRAFT_795601 [Russula compacta]|nr:hypothetical protein BJV74DRAFT_795601 [Russula compacta]
MSPWFSSLPASCAVTVVLLTVAGKHKQPGIYTNDSERTHYCHQKYWREASQGCVNIKTFFTPKSSQLMPKSDMHLRRWWLSLVWTFWTFALIHWKMTAITTSDMDLEIDENGFETAESSVNHIMMELTTDHSDPEMTLEVPAAVDAAHKWLGIDDEDALGPTDIFTIIKRCLIDAKKLKCGCTVKMMLQLTAVSEYVKL